MKAISNEPTAAPPLNAMRLSFEPQPVTPVPVPQRPQPQPPAPLPAPVPVPAAPSIDPAQRQRAIAAIGNARQHVQQAQGRHANGTPQFNSAVQALNDANSRAAGAKTNDDLAQAIAAAENASMLADTAVAPGAPPVPAPQIPAPTRPTAAANAVLGDYQRQLRSALTDYFNGEFESATRGFKDLSQKLPSNGWIWAFLGASQYSQYAFEADETYKAQALDSFRKAKQFRSWKGGLPDKYFSRRIRRVFETAG